MTGLPVQLACELATRPIEQRFLVEHLWGAGAVGIVGGEPKCCKSFLALDLAVAVASGRPCLRRFVVNEPGPVLLFAAEDALHIVRERLDGIAAATQIGLDGLPLHVITSPGLRLDLDGDRRALQQTVANLRPRLLVLDPFVRLHRKNENAADEVAPMLAYLRRLQREYATSVLLVHHARKGGHARPGQALRGSSELHAWGDSNLYLRRKGERLTMTIEHRAAASPPPLTLTLRAEPGLALQVENPDPVPAVPRCNRPTDRLLGALEGATGPMTRRQLREACRMRSSSVGEALSNLVADGLVVEGERGYTTAPGVSR